MYINLSQIYECRNWVTEHYNSVSEITVSFQGMYINGNQTFILDSQQTFTSSALVSKRRADEALLNKEQIAAQTDFDILYSSVFRDQNQTGILQNLPVLFQTEN
jgi:hypothetical protein